jgi:hypothetical protein
MEIPSIKQVPLAEALARRRGATIDRAFLEQLTQMLRNLAADRALLIAVPADMKYPTFKGWVNFAAEQAGVKLVIRRDPDGIRCWRDPSSTQKIRSKKSPPQPHDTEKTSP